MNIYHLLKLSEAPLPDDWDKDVYNQPTTFKDMIAYAEERAEKVGTGSSRVAFAVPYQGRKTVLKIAKNTKGLHQNEEEARLLDDYYIDGLGITIPLIDYDEENSQPTWIHTEYAERITESQLTKFFGHPLSDILSNLDYRMNGGGAFGDKPEELPEEVHENEYYSALEDMIVNYGMAVGDFQRKANWGLYKGEPVIIDLGYHGSVIELYS